MVNRLFTDKCLRCGDTLIADAGGNFNKYHCCTACTKFIEKQVYEMHMKRKVRHDLPPKHKELRTARHLHKFVEVTAMYKEPE